MDIFFVLSGFLITSLLIQEFDRTGAISLRKFYMRRVLRLLPALAAMLIVFCIVSISIFNVQRANANLADALYSFLYISNWTRIFEVSIPDLFGHTWSLSIEEQFYIVWPIILLGLLTLSKNRWHIVIAAAVVALTSWGLRVYLALHGVSSERLYFGLDTRADALMAGCVIGVIYSSGLIRNAAATWIPKWMTIVAPLSAVLLLGFALTANLKSPSMYYWGFVAVELLAALLVLSILLTQRNATRRILSMRWLVWVGSISYGLYLWHLPIYKTIFFYGHGGKANITVGTLATFFIASCSYYFMEKPILKLKSRFTSNTSNPPPPTLR